ncbi:Glycosyl transferase family 2 [Poseidonocella pacifica]|uniref:Glycosyl transferase family 2 n=1 Tax=Poseidonocella pacifica TaxID=871651 RepID=A0A1I0V7N1_9RHOB|nr:glycosyltransferase family 2 protein [Poseidonocella pacifica]SFA72335.1 Glycosyl transferase family 2 [Poseidonocella pacifica]
MGARWGIVATIKASPLRTLEFAAHHLEMGAARLHLFLDADNAAEPALAAHPDITVIRTDAAYWRMRRPRETHRRPPDHQSRQFANAKWAYMHTDLDWIAHIDVDEFLWSDTDLGAELAVLPVECHCARIHPLEYLTPLSSGPASFKSCATAWMQRLQETREIYPTYGQHLNGGFLSHVAGKLFVRCGLPDMKIQIHNVTENGLTNPGERVLVDAALLHFHARSFRHWSRHLNYRLAKGSYRATLAPPVQPAGAPVSVPGALNLHSLFTDLSTQPGGLEHFYREVSTATPALLSRLESFGHLRRYDIKPADARRKLFGKLPDH